MPSGRLGVPGARGQAAPPLAALTVLGLNQDHALLMLVRVNLLKLFLATALAARGMAVGLNGHRGVHAAEVKTLLGTGSVQIHYQLMADSTAQEMQWKPNHVKHSALVSH